MKYFNPRSSFILLALISFTLIQCTKDKNEKDIVVTPEFNVYKIIDGKDIRSIIKTSDGGYAGIANRSDYEIIKFDPDFNVMWDKTYSRLNNDYVTSILQTDDGGYMIIGNSDTTVNNFTHEVIWACRLDEEGELVWDKTYGGSAHSGIYGEKSIIPTDDGGYIFTGNISDDVEDDDIWVVKINFSGEIVSEKTLGSTGSSYGQAIVETNGNYAILATIMGKSDLFPEEGTCIVSLDKSFNMVWDRPLHGWVGGSMLYSENNELVVVSNTGLSAFQLHILGMDGDIRKEEKLRFYPTISSEQRTAPDILKASAGGYIITGCISKYSNVDAIIFRVDDNLDLKYSKIYNGSSYENGRILIPLTENHYLFEFTTRSKDITGIDYPSDIASVVMNLEETITE
jgi:hypothetical protein